MKKILGICFAVLIQFSTFASPSDCFNRLVELIRFESSLVFDPVTHSRETETLWESLEDMLARANNGEEITQTQIEDFFIDLGLKLKKNGNNVFVDTNNREIEILADSKTILGQAIGTLKKLNPSLRFVFNITQAVGQNVLTPTISVKNNTVYLMADALLAFGVDLNSKKVLYTDEATHLIYLISEVLSQSQSIRQWNIEGRLNGANSIGRLPLTKLVFQSLHLEKLVEATGRIDPEVRSELALDLKFWVESTQKNWDNFVKPIRTLQKFVQNIHGQKVEINVRTYSPVDMDIEALFMEQVSETDKRSRLKVRYTTKIRAQSTLHIVDTQDRKYLEISEPNLESTKTFKSLGLKYLLDFEMQQDITESKKQILNQLSEFFEKQTEAFTQADVVIRPLLKEFQSISAKPGLSQGDIGEMAMLAKKFKEQIMELNQKVQSND
jgi:hypothetical protein